jgi:hypothetical protein
MAIFLLSPANLNGVRAEQLASPRATFAAAGRYRSSEGVAIGEAFSFMSALYFRGKLTYARHFGRGPSAALVITPGFGLVQPEWSLTPERMSRMRKIDIDVDSLAYVKPLREQSRELATRLADDDTVVLLGSVATGKYVDILQPIFGDRLRFPAAFAGLGDMARGGLMLRAVREDRELEYVSLQAPRHRPPGANGRMPLS